MVHPDLMPLSSNELVKLFELVSYEISCRVTDDRISVHDMQRTRAWARETAERTDIGIGNKNAAVIGFTTEDKVRKEVAGEVEKFAEFAVSTAVNSTFKWAFKTILAEVAERIRTKNF